MKDLIEYISQIFGLQLTSKIALIDMENDIGEIRDHATYVRYLKSSFNLSDLQYLTAYQKFLELTKRYKRIELEQFNQSKIEKMGSVAERLANKVREIDTIVLNAQNDNHQWEKFKYSNGDNAFNEKEIKALSVIGSPLICVRLQRSISGRDCLAERLETLFVDRITHPQLEAPQQSNQLIANLAQSVKA